MVDMMDMAGEWEDDMFDDVTGDQPDVIKRVTFVIDRSGSMDGTVIGTINAVMEELLLELDEHSTRVSVAEFDEKVEWKTDEPSMIAQYGGWERIHSESFSNMGEMFSQLAAKMSAASWQKENGTKGSKDYIILFSDGLASDDYSAGLKKLQSVPVFQKAKKMAVNFSEISNTPLLDQFAGETGTIINVLGSGAIEKVEKAILKLVK